MKIALDTSPLKNKHNTRGVGVYMINLLEELKRMPELQIQEFNHFGEVGDVDVIHYPYFDLFKHSLFVHRKIPTVVTVHDIIPLIYPKAYPVGIKGNINYFLQKQSLKKVTAIITDSKASKEDIVKYLGISEEKIFPVALAPNRQFHKIQNLEKIKKIKIKFNLPDKFALFLGSVNWNKNLLNLSEAAINANIDLVLIGKNFEERDNLNHPEMKSYDAFLKKYSDNPKVHILGFVGGRELVMITNTATMLLLPSFAEGFGLPILEAQVCGVPVVTSKVSSMPEVAGKGALLVDPYSTESICQAMKNIIQNQKIRQNLINEGFKNVKRFSWSKTAKETVKVYQEAAHKY